MVELALSNCRPEPWASYVRGLAVLRLVAEQKDPDARGFFRNGCFILVSSLDRESLLDFFVKEYRPTPVVSPWNGGSGFYPKDDKTGIERIISSGDLRFEAYSRVINQIFSWPELPNPGRSIEDIIRMSSKSLIADLGKNFKKIFDEFSRDAHSLNANIARLGMAKGKYPYEDIFISLVIIERLKESGEWDTVKGLSIEDTVERKIASCSELIARVKKLRTHIDGQARKGMKEDILRKCRSTLPIEALRWIDATLIVDSDGEASYHPLLWGGNDGRLDYSRTFIGYVGDLLLSMREEECRKLMANSIFGDRTDKLRINVMGMFDPGRAGGYNQGIGIESKDFPSNPWDFVLAIEGSILWASSITRREGDRMSSLSSPFTARGKAVGYASASDMDESGTFELWAPLWEKAASMSEVKYLMAEGRAYIGRTMPKNSVQFAIALANLGVDRGIGEFVRYGILKRRGDNKVIMPLGRFKVRRIPSAHLLEELDGILKNLDRFLAQFKGQVPASLGSARRGVDTAILETVARGSAISFKNLLAAVGRMERLIGQRDPSKEPKLNRPLSGLSMEWLLTIDDGTPEIRIAGAISSIFDPGLGPWRAHMEPVDPERPILWTEGKSNTSFGHGDICRNLAYSLHRRILLSDRSEGSHPMRASIWLHPSDAILLLRKELDEQILDDLLWGMTWIDWKRKRYSSDVLEKVRNDWRQPIADIVVPRGWSMLAATLVPRGVKVSDEERIEVKPDVGMISLLMAGRYNEAVKAARTRLYSSGVPVRATMPDEGFEGMEVAASLMVPIGLDSVSRSIMLKEEKE